jgi:hypothetical protein
MLVSLGLAALTFRNDGGGLRDLSGYDRLLLLEYLSLEVLGLQQLAIYGHSASLVLLCYDIPVWTRGRHLGVKKTALFGGNNLSRHLYLRWNFELWTGYCLLNRHVLSVYIQIPAVFGLAPSAANASLFNKVFELSLSKCHAIIISLLLSFAEVDGGGQSRLL